MYYFNKYTVVPLQSNLVYAIRGNLDASSYFNITYGPAGAVVRVKTDLRLGGDRATYYQVKYRIRPN